jgi:hypothetical protein
LFWYREWVTVLAVRPRLSTDEPGSRLTSPTFRKGYTR